MLEDNRLFNYITEPLNYNHLTMANSTTLSDQKGQKTTSSTVGDGQRCPVLGPELPKPST